MRHPINLPDYYNRLPTATTHVGEQVDAVLHRAGRMSQSAENNELQSIISQRIRHIGDALFANGDVVRDGACVVNPDTGDVILESGAIYLAGSIYGVPPARFTLPTIGAYKVGVVLTPRVITELEDPSLYNPAINTLGEGEAGAARLIISTNWSHSALPIADGAEFYAVYDVLDGHLGAKEPPPHMSATTQAIARYDRDSAGGTYVVSGLKIQAVADEVLDTVNHQVYVVDKGRARVAGLAIELQTARRYRFATQPDIKAIDSEPHLADGTTQTLTLNRYPAAKIDTVKITSFKTVNVVHANYSDSQDPLPDATVIAILEVRQGATIYQKDIDYKLITGKVDWTLGGAEPLPGSTYEVDYHYVRAVVPDASTNQSVTITGAISGTLIYVSYQHLLPRIDRLCLDAEGRGHWVEGVSADFEPRAPKVPDNLLLLSSIYQFWDDRTRLVRNDGVRVVPMDELFNHGKRLDYLAEMIARTRLEMDANTREAGAKRGLFVDPFINDDMRDNGSPQNAAIVDGFLMLPIAAEVISFTAGSGVITLDHTLSAVLSQAAQTECMLINPYQTFDPIPAAVSINPAIDRWTVTNLEWSSPITRRFTGGNVGTVVIDELLNSASQAAEFLRPITITVEIDGFGQHEVLKAASFDGIDVMPSVMGGLVADSFGRLTFNFTIPANVPAGKKMLYVEGMGTTNGFAEFFGEGVIITELRRSVTTITTAPPPPEPRWNWPPLYDVVDPLAQTFLLGLSRQIGGVALTFCAKGIKHVLVQIRETANGVPTSKIIAESRIPAAAINLDGTKTVASFKAPVLLTSGVEYAIVVLSDEATPSIKVASLGGFDDRTQTWVTAQPYTVGVLLSSSNASTWTAHQDKDMTFDLLACDFVPPAKDVFLGSIEVTDATDFISFFDAEIPDATAAARLTISIGQDAFEISDNQPLALTTHYTGRVDFAARLTGNAQYSPVLHPDLQIAIGTLQSSADYISRAIVSGIDARIRVIIDAHLPSGSTLTALLSSAGINDYDEMPLIETRMLDAGFRELTFEVAQINFDAVQIKLQLTGAPSARPRASNLRVLII